MIFRKKILKARNIYETLSSYLIDNAHNKYLGLKMKNSTREIINLNLVLRMVIDDKKILFEFINSKKQRYLKHKGDVFTRIK